MSESSPPSFRPLLHLAAIVMLVGAGLFFASNYQVEGLDGLSIRSREDSENTNLDEGIDALLFAPAPEFGSNFPATGSVGPTTGTPVTFASGGSVSGSSSAKGNARSKTPSRESSPQAKSLRVGSWALGGFGPSKFSDAISLRHLVRTLRAFDVVALQQIRSPERDLIPRLVDIINAGGRRYDFVLAEPSKSGDGQEQLAVLFDSERVVVDRTQTYVVADPANQMTTDPLVVWFRATEPSVELAWTFTLVNVRIELARAPTEVALLQDLFHSVRMDGRGEDDVIMAGLFQADDIYLLQREMGSTIDAVVRNVPTDIFGRHQTSNILVDRERTNEYLGRGGPIDFLRRYNLSLAEAEAVSSQLPVYGEFTVHEGGAL